jgi:hypothetical protein
LLRDFLSLFNLLVPFLLGSLNLDANLLRLLLPLDGLFQNLGWRVLSAHLELLMGSIEHFRGEQFVGGFRA